MKYLIVFALFAVVFADVKNVRQKFKATAVTAINEQITRELQASYFYQAYSQYFARSDVALSGFSKFFSEASKEERSHAEQLMEYINKRGGDVQLKDIKLQDVCNIVTKGLEDVNFSFTKTKSCICNFMTGDKTTLSSLECDSTLRDDWHNGLLAMEDTLVLERYVNEKLLKLHEDYDDDAHLSHVLEHDFLEEQVNAIKDIADKIRQLKRAGKGLGEYLFDQKM
ncbi:yolk ferritin-like [Saccostrea echinata]|uniref:yolk ferritin-like n=1 Tax=Saccostrea echinata TaxID=191078 RepID=UPI002A7FE1B4|nr:yolk ferritin-like [Saccostrea echinata]